MKVFYVMFFKTELTYRDWWRVISGNEWTHCVCFQALPSGGILLGEYVRGVIRTDVLDMSVSDAVRHLGGALELKGIVRFEVEVDKLDEMRYIPLRIFSCVEYVKAQLGVNTRWVMTPQQLFKHLSSIGGESYGRTLRRTGQTGYDSASGTSGGCPGEGAG